VVLGGWVFSYERGTLVGPLQEGDSSPRNPGRFLQLREHVAGQRAPVGMAKVNVQIEFSGGFTPCGCHRAAMPVTLNPNWNLSFNLCWKLVTLRPDVRASRTEKGRVSPRTSRELASSYRGTSLIRNRHPLGPYSRPMHRALWWS